MEKYWNHDAFFDYMGRWMYQDETPYFETVIQPNVRVGWEPMKDWAKQGEARRHEETGSIRWQ